MTIVSQRKLSLAVFIVLTIGLMGCGSSHSATKLANTMVPNVVATYGGQTLTLGDFEYQYARSIGGIDQVRGDSLSAYQDFLKRYVDFKLKVLAAEASGLDTDSTILDEIAKYRSQLARPYLLDQKVKEPLLKDLYEKRKEVIDASHILIRLDKNAAPKDTLIAYNKLIAIRDSVLQGVDFGDMAVRHSEDPSAKGSGLGARGRLGYFSAGKMVKPFEDWAYKTAPGQVSPVFRTQFGYHILLVHDRKIKPADIQIAHIMIRPKGTSPADTVEALARIDSIQARLKDGEPFADVAKSSSDDRASARAGGNLGNISYDSRLLVPLKDAGFALKEVGDVSPPILTQFGYHLIKLTGRTTKKSFEDSREDLDKLVARLPRAKKAEESFARRVRAERGVTIDTTGIMAVFSSSSVDTVFQALNRALVPDSLQGIRFATLGDSSYSIHDLLAFAKTHPVIRRPTVKEQVFATVDDFLNDRAINYKVQALEERDVDFRNTMQEFHDGLLLFRLMQDSVWTPATEDTLGLKAYFSTHPGEYKYDTRTRIVGIFGRSDVGINKYYNMLKSGTTPEEVISMSLSDSLSHYRVDTTLVSKKTDSIFDQAVALNEGEFTTVIPYNKGFLILFNEGTVPARDKTFEEAKAEVVNDYQKVLEDRLLTRLHKRYHARTFPQRLTGAFKESASADGDTTVSSLN